MDEPYFVGHSHSSLAAMRVKFAILAVATVSILISIGILVRPTKATGRITEPRPTSPGWYKVANLDDARRALGFEPKLANLPGASPEFYVVVPFPIDLG